MQFSYDFKGNVLLLQKQFTTDYSMEPNWNNTVLLGELFATDMTYDALNRIVSVKHLDGSVLNYHYDKGGMLKQVLQGSTQHITNITYNPKGQRENIYYGNNTKTRYDYHPLNFRLTKILTTRNTGSVILQDLNYTYDAVGNITKIQDNAQQTNYFSNSVIAPVSTFEYDALYRLVKATGRELNALSAPTNADFVNTLACPNTAANAMRNYTHHYSYDQLGNIQSDGWKSYVYDTATNRLLRHTGTTNVYTYDAHGNMAKMPNITSMNWDYKDQLISAANGTSFTSYYSYDAEGNRSRKVTVKGTVREERYYIGGYEVYRKYTGTTLTTERETVNISDDEKVFVRNEGGVERYQYDNHLGSACLELDTAGLMISYEEYHPFGTTSYRAGKGAAEVSLKRYKYCGKERDEETGLYYYGARYYASWLGRFVSVDPLADKYPSISPYVYCANNPVKYVDPDGRGPIDRVEAARTMLGIEYKQETDMLLRTSDSSEAMQYMDCSEFVSRVLAMDQITEGIQSMNSSKLKDFFDDTSQFIHSKDTPQAGDIAVWKGHVGIVTEVGEGGKIKLAHARGSGKLSDENKYAILPEQYRSSEFYGYYRPINETSEGKLNATEVNPMNIESTPKNVFQNQNIQNDNVSNQNNNIDLRDLIMPIFF